MKKFISRIQEAPGLVAGLEDSGYKGELLEADDRYLFVKDLNDEFVLQLLLSPQREKSISVGMLIASAVVKRAMHSFNLFLDDPVTSIDSPEVVLAVDLLWLRWNGEPERAPLYKFDYGFGTQGVDRLFEDLNTVGRDFVDRVTTLDGMAEMLVNIMDYPTRIKWGGAPRSVEPYMYSSILFLSLGDRQRMKAALDKGLCEYETTEPRSDWQNRRLRNLRMRTALLMG